MSNFHIDNIFIEFGGRVFQQTVAIPMGTNCDLFLSIYFCTHKKPSLSKSVFVKIKDISTVLYLHVPLYR